MCCATAIIHRIDQTKPTNLDLKSTWHLLRAESCRKQYTCRSCWSSRKTMGFARYFSNHSLLAQTLNAGMNVTKMSRIYEFAGKLHQRWPTDESTTQQKRNCQTCSRSARLLRKTVLGADPAANAGLTDAYFTHRQQIPNNLNSYLQKSVTASNTPYAPQSEHKQRVQQYHYVLICCLLTLLSQ